MTKQEIIALVILCIVLLGVIIAFFLFFSRYRRVVKKEVDEGSFDMELLNTYKDSSNKSIQKKRKVFAVIRKIVYTLFIVIIIGLLVLALTNKLGWTKFGNKNVMVVASGSMSVKNPANDYLVENNLNNQFPTYSLIVVEKVDKPEDLKLYDVIVYKDANGKNIIHRIVRIEESASGTHYVTRGDSNNEYDDYKPTFQDVQGRYTNVKFLGVGAVIMFMQSALGIATVVALIACLLILDNARNKIAQIKEDRLKDLIAKYALTEEKILQMSDIEMQAMLKEDAVDSEDA